MLSRYTVVAFLPCPASTNRKSCHEHQLVLTGADGRNPKELTQEGIPALDGEYSPDGKAVFYRSKVNGTWTLMSVDTKRSSQKRIWNAPGKFLGFSVCEKKSN